MISLMVSTLYRPYMGDLVNNVCLFSGIACRCFLRLLARNFIPVLRPAKHERLTREIRDDSDIKNTASQLKDGAKIISKPTLVFLQK